ncbi:HAD family hydrolase [Thermoleptolyngbya sp. C42_A2020_037]|uniref:HAD family hydrolase n=1 Tax=Thermoleptolyngbya sp. C42_A2020_037 TaxID=2747799 RepID=UPI0019EC445D|nr:HAD family hydrolase [Thermoleptolyngbya sp. C42_A2020_037]MBF2085005.1 HAD family hydrolase [Thermoleptolyngbya sp. C42_A2020_037]
MLIWCGSVMFSDVQAMVFDKDGTLADSAHFLRMLAQRRSRLIDARVPGVESPLQLAFGLDGDQLNPAGLMAVGTRRENEIAAAAYVAETGRGWLESLALVQSAFLEADQSFSRKADHTPCYEDGAETLQRLAAAGLKLAILSSDTTAQVVDFADRYELTPYLQVCQGTDEGPSKPDPILLEQVCGKLGVLPGQTLVVGDSQADVQLAIAARAAGCIGIARNPAAVSGLAGASSVIESLQEIRL